MLRSTQLADSDAGELACVATHPEFHNQGIASRLLKCLEKDATDNGLKTLFVLTTQTAHWFREQGFSEADVSDATGGKTVALQLPTPVDESSVKTLAKTRQF